MRVTLLDNSGERASDGAHHVGKHAAGSRFKLTGLRIGSEAATKESAPRETPAALKTLQQDLLGCDNQTRAFLELIVSRFGTVNRSSDHVFYKLLLSVSL